MIEFMESSVAPINNVSGLSRRKEGFDSPWGYLFYKELDVSLLTILPVCILFAYPDLLPDPKLLMLHVTGQRNNDRTS